MKLVDVNPKRSSATLVSRFKPPVRFDDVRFENYRPSPEYPTQEAARASLAAFAAKKLEPAKKSFFKRSSKPTTKPARYLDGGFGVGKTHLLASLWHASAGPKSYITFEELTAFIGFVGINTAIAEFKHHQLLCIDEFELDDVANTLMVVSFLRGVLSHEKDVQTRLAVTSNTLPGALGEQRFSASEFTREIAAIADHFDEMKIDGADFRTNNAALPLANLSDDQLEHVTHDQFNMVLGHLGKVHPVFYGSLLDGIDGVVIEGLEEIKAQDTALLFVQFIDKLYDAKIPVKLTGIEPDELFAERYRNAGYRKKYGRAISRMKAMAGESAGLL